MPDLIARVSRSLGRNAVPGVVPNLPSIGELCTRLVDPLADLLAIFTERAEGAKIHVHLASALTVNQAIVEQVLEAGHRSVVTTRCAIFDQIGLLDALKANGLNARYWDSSSLDASYDIDVGITDVWCAVAETGSLVIRSSTAHGRAVSLVPSHHIAIVERSQIVPDLIDVMHKIEAVGSGSGIVLITGPSKTADIEMNLVTGVHGPGRVDVFIV